VVHIDSAEIRHARHQDLGECSCLLDDLFEELPGFLQRKVLPMGSYRASKEQGINHYKPPRSLQKHASSHNETSDCQPCVSSLHLPFALRPRSSSPPKLPPSVPKPSSSTWLRKTFRKGMIRPVVTSVQHYKLFCGHHLACGSRSKSLNSSRSLIQPPAISLAGYSQSKLWKLSATLTRRRREQSSP
jgi:hypothetical protein